MHHQGTEEVLSLLFIYWKRKRFGLLKLNIFKNILSNVGRFREMFEKAIKNNKKTAGFQTQKHTNKYLI